MQSRAFHGMEVAALCPDTKRAPPPLVRLRKTTRVCLPVSSSSPILTARPSFSPNISLFILPTFERKSEYEYFSASCTTSNRQFRPFAFLANGIAPPPCEIPGTRLRHDSKRQDVDSQPDSLESRNN